MNKKLERRIKQIVNHLRPATGLAGKFNPPQSLRERMAYYHTPGVSIAILNDFEIEWAQGFGRRATRSTSRVTTETLFQAGSISKPIFALGIMRLVQAGRLNLDDDIQRYLSSWRVPANDGWQPRLTLRQLLSHTAGLTVHGFPGYQASERLPTVRQILNGEAPANTAKVEVNILPGTQFRYSGGGTTVAQQALVDFLNKPFPQIMNELVLQPLGLTNSTYEQPLPKRWAKRVATAYPWKGIPLKGKFHTYPEMAAAGLWTTATDLAKVGVELLQVLHARKGHTLLVKETIESMLRPQLDHQKIGESEFVGLGFFCNGKDDAFYFGHGGWDEGFVAQMRFYKNIGKGAVVMLNSNEGFPLLDEIMRALGEAYEWPEALPKEKTAVRLANLHDYAGFYATKTGTQFRVGVTGDNLIFQYGQQPPLPIFASSEAEFFTPALNVDIRFDKDDKAGIVALTVSQEGNQIKADKKATA
jgi:CubicO group peptidase (beta-lactamase class C family)